MKQDIVFKETLRGHSMEFHSTWGLFNPRHVDEGSRLLIDQLTVRPDHRSLDIGCGYGPIGLTLARLCPQGEVHMIDKDFVAVEFARKNASINRIFNCHVYLSNAFSCVPDIRFHNIVTNLPANSGNEMLSIILHDAWNHLEVGGQLYVVTISRLKGFIGRNLRMIFGNYEKVKQGRDHTVARAVKE